MKVIRFILVINILSIIQAFNVSGKNYYISNSGNDNNSGTSPFSPWKSIDKINSNISNISGGDSILFDRGGIFFGQLNISKSGSAGSSIIIGAYGEGARPILSGAILLSNWSVNSGKIYSTDIQSTVKNIFVDDKEMTLARYPNNGWLFTTSGNGNNGFYDGQLFQADNYWNGANVRIRSINWAYEYRKVSSYQNKTVIFDKSLSYSLTANLGFYFDNVLSELDSASEWFFDDSAKRIYFYPPSDKNPNELNVYGSIYDYGIKTDWTISYLLIRDISFKMYAIAGAWFGSTCSGISIINCVFDNCTTGIEIDGNPATNILIDQNIITNSNARAIYGYSLQSSVISNNTIKESGLIPGYGTDGVNGALGICIAGFPEDNSVYKNIVDSTGYIGIRCDGQNNTVKNNIVKNSMLTLSDGGAIYCWGNSTLNSSIVANYIENVQGNSESCPDLATLAMGIYLDDYSSYISILNNTVVNANGNGIFIHNSNNNIITGNITFNSAKGGISYAEDITGGNKNNLMTYNIFYSLKEDQIPLSLSASNGISVWGTFQNNYYCNPYNSNVVKYQDPSYATHYFGLHNWKIFSGQDQDSKESHVLKNRFEVTDTIGNDLIENGNFDSNINSWNLWPLSNSISWLENGGLDGGCLKFTLNLSDPGTIGRVYCNNFWLEKLAYYQLNFSVLGVDFGPMFLTTTSNNSTNFTNYYPIETERIDYNTIFSVPQVDYNFRFDFQIDSAASSINIDNVHLHKVDGSFADPWKYSHLFTNPSDNTVTYDLQQAVFKDLDGNEITGSIVLQPWESEVLLYTSGIYDSTKEVENQIMMQLQPNPVLRGNELTINLNAFAPSDLTIRIYDSLGRLYLTQKISSAETIASIKTNKLARGVFIVYLTGAHVSKAEKLVVY